MISQTHTSHFYIWATLWSLP